MDMEELYPDGLAMRKVNGLKLMMIQENTIFILFGITLLIV
ncbi:hypothetical protein VCRA2110O318_220003 [Vibrio crassostreae]|nr:hypothetical protein VCRA2110O318_220003 [Vibrio crassostreae]CAK2452792.1 hypothetical protein VCRA2110O319_230003 [Vibrio crassostreae]CAK2775487.1 hypothetical protein VCRA217O317_230003 [Vibrio crassostreae]